MFEEGSLGHEHAHFCDVVTLTFGLLEVIRDVVSNRTFDLLGIVNQIRRVLSHITFAHIYLLLHGDDVVLKVRLMTFEFIILLCKFFSDSIEAEPLQRLELNRAQMELFAHTHLLFLQAFDELHHFGRNLGRTDQ